MKLILSTILTTFVCFSATGQRPPAISSPDINSDKSITFRYFSKTAERVWVSGEFLKTPVQMEKDTSGIWSVTVAPVTPDIYPYSLVPRSDRRPTIPTYCNERFKRSILYSC